MIRLLIILVAGIALTAGSYFKSETVLDYVNPSNCQNFDACEAIHSKLERTTRGFPLEMSEGGTVTQTTGDGSIRDFGGGLGVAAVGNLAFWIGFSALAYFVYTKLLDRLGRLALVVVVAVGAAVYFGLLTIG